MRQTSTLPRPHHKEEMNSATTDVPNVLVCDEDRLLASSIAECLSGHGYRVRVAASYVEAKSAVKTRLPDVLVLSTGLDITDHLRKAAPAVPMVMLSSANNAGGRVKSRAAGASEVIPKHPLDLARLTDAVKRAKTPRRATCVAERDPVLIGESPAWTAALTKAKKFAALDNPVLLCGESGTGKELVARYVHKHSERAEGDFLPINCAAVPEPLLESELFGHVRGAFTGAVEEKPGLLEQADGGTVFLDEVSSLPLPLQPKLLRFLQDRVVRKVGGTARARVNVRIVAAANEDLAEKVRTGGFRADLMYRLDVLRIELPPLRDRKTDIPLLANHFLAAAAAEMRKRPPVLSPAAMKALTNHDWPGNVRELENVITAAVALADGKIELADLPARLIR